MHTSSTPCNLSTTFCCWLPHTLCLAFGAITPKNFCRAKWLFSYAFLVESKKRPIALCLLTCVLGIISGCALFRFSFLQLWIYFVLIYLCLHSISSAKFSDTTSPCFDLSSHLSIVNIFAQHQIPTQPMRVLNKIVIEFQTCVTLFDFLFAESVQSYVS